MEDNKNLQPEPELSPEERLDQLLAEFLAAPDMEVPPVSQPEDTELDSAFFFDLSPTAEEEPAPAETAPPVEDDVDILPILDVDHNDTLPETIPESPALSDIDIPEPQSAPAEETVTEAPQETPSDTPIESEEILPLEALSIGESLAPADESTEIGVDEQALEAAGLTTVEPEEAYADLPTEEEPTANIPILISTHTPENPDTKEQSPMPEENAEQHAAEALPETEEYIPPRKIRPKKKGTYGFFSIPHMAAVAIWLAIIVFVGVGLGNILWEYASDMLAFGRESKTVTITILPSDDLDAICKKLHSTGLIKYPGLFKLYADLTDAMEEINPGTYTLNTVYDYMALKKSMSSLGARATTKVVIPEGYTTKQIFALLEAKGVSTIAELEAAARKVQADDYWFLVGIDESSEQYLEGYLFPDTYEFYLGEDPDTVISKLLNNFNKRFNDTMKANLVTLNETLSEMMRKNGLSEEYIAQHQLTIREIVIIASMIEKESANTSESFTVASVIYNRLTNPNAYPYLQIDATLVYVIGHGNLTAEDLALDSPYNTYKNPGLIPGPISNPSRASLDAALDPDSTPYYYYALNPNTGEHKFSETLAEHDAFLDSLYNQNEETP